MNAILKWAAAMLISIITDAALDSDSVGRVKNFIVAQANAAIDNTVKHQRAADLIKEIAGDLSDTVVDWVIRTILWVARATGQIVTK